MTMHSAKLLAKSLLVLLFASISALRAQDTRPVPVASVDRVQAVVLQSRPDSGQVPSVKMREAIEASGLPWRIVTRPNAIEFVLIPKSSVTVQMSHPSAFAERDVWPANAGMTYRDMVVDVEHPFYFSRTEVTQSTIAKSHPGLVAEMRSRFSVVRESHPRLRDRLALNVNAPIVGVSLSEARDIAGGLGARLPSEAEWTAVYLAGEHIDSLAHSAGAVHKGNFLDREFSSAYGWSTYSGESADDGFVGLAPAASFPCDSLGVFDMRGNAMEWAWPRFPVVVRPRPRDNEPIDGSPIRVRAGRIDTVKERFTGRRCGSSWLTGDFYSFTTWRDFFSMDGRKDRADMSKLELGVRLVIEPDGVIF